MPSFGLTLVKGSLPVDWAGVIVAQAGPDGYCTGDGSLVQAEEAECCAKTSEPVPGDPHPLCEPFHSAALVRVGGQLLLQHYSCDSPLQS